MASKSKQARLAGRQKSAAEPAQSPNSSSKLDLQGPGIVTATSQTSRFHVDTLSTLSKEVRLSWTGMMSCRLANVCTRLIYTKVWNRDSSVSICKLTKTSVNIAYDKKDILVDAHLRIKSDVVYGLVGRNGEGKSSKQSQTNMPYMLCLTSPRQRF